MLSEVFVMHFMRPPDCFQINRIRFAEHFKTLMDKNIMHHKVSKTVNSDPKPDIEQIIGAGIKAKQKTCNAWRGKNHKEIIILFKKIAIVPLVVIVVQKPEGTMHQIFMGEPRDAFHSYKCGNDNQCIGNPGIHNIQIGCSILPVNEMILFG